MRFKTRMRIVVALTVFALGTLAVSAQQKAEEKAAPAPPPYVIPPEAVKQENPIKPSPESLDRARKVWAIDCEMCHGATGDGKSDLARDMKLVMPDLTDAAVTRELTDGAMFYIIKNGKNAMPKEGERAKDDAMWDLVNYVRSLAKKPAEAKK